MTRKKQKKERQNQNKDGTVHRTSHGKVAEVPESPEQVEEDMEDLRKRAGERDEYYDLMLRARADLENFSKRMDKEKIRWKETSLRNFVSDMLPALDALHVAISHTEETEASSILDGVRLMEKEISKVFHQNGIDIVEPNPGDVFDPALHEAVMSDVTDEFEPGHVTAVLRRGFSASGILVRAAQVKVAAQKSEEQAGKELADKEEGGDS